MLHSCNRVADASVRWGRSPWAGFRTGLWQTEINVRDFIQQNYEPYDGDEHFLAPGDRAHEEDLGDARGAVPRGADARASSTSRRSPARSRRTRRATSTDNEVIVGLQTDAPLKRAIMPNGGFRLVVTALKAYGYEPDPNVVEAFTKYRKTHNDAVFDAYTADVRRCRSSHVLTGLPDAYGRGRIIGDYRRVALYGVKRLIERKQEEKAELDTELSSDGIIRDREELAEQIKALKELLQMAKAYGFDISKPAVHGEGSRAVAVFRLPRRREGTERRRDVAGARLTFLDVYFERDLAAGTLTEEQAQEIVDDFVIKLRIVRFLRTPEYDELFAGDPTWVTESIGGMGDDGRTLVTKTSFRILHTLYNLGPAPEPNLTVWYSPRLPDGFRRYSAKVAIDTSSLQFESDEIMRRAWGDDGAIACCVSPMLLGKQMQFFGARTNLAKCLLYAINGGRDEVSGEQISPPFEPVTGDVLEFDAVIARFEKMMDWLAGVYVNAMNVIHYMHDKYAYERVEMALHDYAPLRTMAFGIAGMSVVADSLSAIKYAKVRVVRDETGLITDYKTEGEFPLFGNNDNRVDQLAAWAVSTFMNKLRKIPDVPERAAHAVGADDHVERGLRQGDGEHAGWTAGRVSRSRPGANPMHGRDSHGIHAAAASVAKIPYRDAADGISLTTTLVPEGLGRIAEDRVTNLTSMMDAFFGSTGYHMNINVLNREMLLDAMDHPEKYPSLTIRVSGYAVNFVRLTREQQMDVVNRTFHGVAHA